MRVTSSLRPNVSLSSPLSLSLNPTPCTNRSFSPSLLISPCLPVTLSLLSSLSLSPLSLLSLSLSPLSPLYLSPLSLSLSLSLSPYPVLSMSHHSISNPLHTLTLSIPPSRSISLPLYHPLPISHYHISHLSSSSHLLSSPYLSLSLSPFPLLALRSVTTHDTTETISPTLNMTRQDIQLYCVTFHRRIDK